MDLGQLEVFLTVVREGKFSRAAEKLHRTQSAVSQSIHKLEEDVGESLFDRSSRDGLLTDAGRVLQEYAERLLNLRDDATGALGELRQLNRGKLSIAANEFTALYLLPVLAEFRRLHPMIRIAVQRSLGSHIPGGRACATTLNSASLLTIRKSRNCTPSSLISMNYSSWCRRRTRWLARPRSASGNWARSHSSPTSSPRPIARR